MKNNDTSLSVTNNMSAVVIDTCKQHLKTPIVQALLAQYQITIECVDGVSYGFGGNEIFGHATFSAVCSCSILPTACDSDEITVTVQLSQTGLHGIIITFGRTLTVFAQLPDIVFGYICRNNMLILDALDTV